MEVSDAKARLNIVNAFECVPMYYLRVSIRLSLSKNENLNNF